MYARVATFENDPAEVDSAIARIRENIDAGMPTMPGLVGAKFLMLANRESGKMVGIALFDTEEALHAGDAARTPGRARPAAAPRSSSSRSGCTRSDRRAEPKPGSAPGRAHEPRNSPWVPAKPLAATVAWVPGTGTPLAKPIDCSAPAEVA